MKYIISILAFIMPLLVSAQDVTDTLVVENGKVFTITTTNYDNGNQMVFKQLLADTSTIQTVYSNLIASKAAALAIDVQSISRYPAIMTDLRKNALSLLSATGKDIMAEIQANNEAYFLNTAATWDVNGSPTTLSKTLAGVMRYKIGSSATKTLTIFGNVIRLNGYETGRNVDLYKISANVWINPDRTIVLRRTLTGSRQ